MNVLEKSTIINVAESYLNNFKKHLLEHVRHNDYEALNDIYTEIDVLEHAINTKQIVSSDYFLDVLSEMRQLTINIINDKKQNKNKLLSESILFELNLDNRNVINSSKLKRMIKYTLISNDQLRDMSYKLHDVINNYNSSQYAVECNSLFGKYDIERYNQLYEVIIKNNNIYDSEQNNNMSTTNNKTGNDYIDKISINEIKSMIDTIINETLTNEINYLVPDPSDPQDSVDDFAGDNLKDLRDTVNTLISSVKNETGDWEKSYDRLVDIYKKLTAAIDNPRLSGSERKRLEHDYDGILGMIHNVIGGGGGGAEKMYVAETTSKPINDRQRMLIVKWCETMGCRKAAIRMIDSVLNTSIGLSSADLADTTTFANGVDSIEDALEAQDYQGAYEMAKDTASEMVAEEGGDDLMEGKCGCGEMEEECNCKQLSECGSWNEAVKHPQFKNVIMKEVAPPGMESWIKSNKERFKKQYGNIKKAMSILYATAWKMFYKNKNKGK